MDFSEIIKKNIFFFTGIFLFIFLWNIPNALGMGEEGKDLTQTEFEDSRARQKRPLRDPLENGLSNLHSDSLSEEKMFLAAVEKTEKDFGLNKSSSSFSSKKRCPPSHTIPSSIAAPAARSDDASLNPKVLKTLRDAETACASDKQKSPSQKKSSEISSRLLTTFQQHQNHLLASIQKARKSILITSHSFSSTQKFHRQLFDALQEASSRNVKVYLYFNKDSGLPDEEVHFLEAASINLSNPFVHSKLLIIDRSLVTCGSFDWLSNPLRMQSNKESSVILEGDDLNPFIEEIWDTLKKYKHVSLHPHTYSKVERKFDSLPSLVFETEEETEEYELLTTPQQHDDFFLNCFENAQHSLTLCAPFITRDIRHLSSILPRSILDRFLKAKKLLQIFYRADDENIVLLRQYLKEFMAHSTLMLIPVDRLHRKTLITDDKYVEGSFNWLSSARTLEDDYFLMETSFVFTGSTAHRFTEEFYRSMRFNLYNSQR